MLVRLCNGASLLHHAWFGSYPVDLSSGWKRLRYRQLHSGLIPNMFILCRRSAAPRWGRTSLLIHRRRLHHTDTRPVSCLLTFETGRDLLSVVQVRKVVTPVGFNREFRLASPSSLRARLSDGLPFIGFFPKH